MEKIKKMKNDLHALKKILYDMGHLTIGSLSLLSDHDFS